MKIHTLTKEEVLRTLVTSEKGLSEKEAGRRLQEYGRNEIREVRKGGLYLRFLSQFTHFLAVLLWIAAALCLLSEYMHPGEGMLLLALAVIAVICINAIFTFIQEYRAERALEALRRLLPFNVKVVREGTTREVNATEVVPGDIIVLAEGDRVPADARIVDSGRLMVDNAPLTGESEAKPRTHEPFDGDLLDSPNIVFAGTHSVSGTCKAVVFATGMSTEFGKIAHLTSAVKPGLSPLQKELLKVTRVIALIAVTTGAFFFGLGFVVGKSFWHNLLFAIGITIANVPEGLLPTVTLSLAMGSQRMAKRKALIKTLTSVETLGSVTVICSDKTGTLTQGKMAVTRIWYENRFIEAEEPDMTNAHELMRIAYLCNNARFVDGQYRGDATEVALLKVVREAIGDLESERVLEIPFDSERKRMTTIDRLDRQLLVHTKGAFETVLPLCDRIRWGGETIVLREEQREALTDAYHSMTDEGLRVISFAFSPQEESETSLQSSPDAAVESRLIFAGLMGIEDPPRPEVPDAIRKCREAGIKVVMITGDAARTAVAIGKQIGLSSDDARVVEGSLLDHMPDAGVRECLTAREIIFARMNPRHKMRIVSVLKDEGERVAVTGDGVNDAPALKKADVGIAMGIAGTDVAKETADVVLLDDNFATIVNAVEEGRATFDNIRKFITYIFAHGTPEAVPYILFALFNIPLPLTVMEILAIDLGTETLPALALGVERAEPNIMKRPPRPPEKGLIDAAVLFRGYVFIGFISAAIVLFAYFYVLYAGGWHWGMVLPMDSTLARQATTATFLAIVIMQIGSVFACRSSVESVFSMGILTNRMVIVGILFEIVLSVFIIYHPIGNSLFGTAPVDSTLWLILLPFSAVLLAADELRKLYVRRTAN